VKKNVTPKIVALREAGEKIYNFAAANPGLSKVLEKLYYNDFQQSLQIAVMTFFIFFAIFSG
jgi:hypothetical protein